jgi:hypothetical protein
MNNKVRGKGELKPTIYVLGLGTFFSIVSADFNDGQHPDLVLVVESSQNGKLIVFLNTLK